MPVSICNVLHSFVLHNKHQTKQHQEKTKYKMHKIIIIKEKKRLFKNNQGI